MTSLLVSVHVPKCGGTSFRHLLRELYGDALWLNYGAIFTREQAKAEIIPAGTRCIHGHFLGDAFDSLWPDRQLVTWVRDPVQRVVSNYYHFLRGPDLRDDCCRALIENQLTLVEFAELDWMRNEATRYLAAKPLDAFAFVGVTERFRESLGVFSDVVGFDGELAERRDNVNSARIAKCYTLTRRESERLRELNREDIAFYEEACQRLDLTVHELRSAAV